jgi:glyoxalase family protein
MQLTGIHHLTAISADAPGNHAFYTQVLGMRLVKKTVNQDDVSAYHLFYADRLANAGVTRADVREIDDRRQLDFEDPEGQRLALIDDGGVGEAHPWARSPVPADHQIRGLGPITISVPRLDRSAAFATEVLGMRASRRYEADGAAVQVFELGEGGPGAELHMRIEPGLPPAQQGAGAVHHVAFRVPDAGYGYWVDRYQRLGIRSSGPVDRFYFRSLYTREPGGILYEIATDGPGFATDETLDTLGESLSLPPFLESKRASIERNLKPL